MLAAPFAPFITDRIFTDLNSVSGRHADSVHLCSYPTADTSLIDKDLENMMDVAQRVSSMVLALRRKVSIKVRQPLTKIIIPVLDRSLRDYMPAIESLIKSEVNVKEIELIDDTAGIITKRIKPNFKTLGPKYGKQMKQISALVAAFSQEDIAGLEAAGGMDLNVGGEMLPMTIEDFEITSEDMPGWLVSTEGRLTVALDITVTEELHREGIARELINRIQNIRKDSGFEVTDKRKVCIARDPMLEGAIADFADYIAAQTLAVSVELANEASGDHIVETDIDEKPVKIGVTRV
jgi:isoleucyl-tRNA synthetase